MTDFIQRIAEDQATTQRGGDLDVPCFTLRRGGGRKRQAGEGGLNRPVAEPGD